MKEEIKKQENSREYWFDEGCFITEVANDNGDEFLSIAKARVAPGSTTAWHKLVGVSERYVIVGGSGFVEIGDDVSEHVQSGDVVRIPAGSRQRIRNTGGCDLIFYAVCAPRFTKTCYVRLEE